MSRTVRSWRSTAPADSYEVEKRGITCILSSTQSDIYIYYLVNINSIIGHSLYLRLYLSGGQRQRFHPSCADELHGAARRMAYFVPGEGLLHLGSTQAHIRQRRQHSYHA